MTNTKITPANALRKLADVMDANSDFAEEAKYGFMSNPLYLSDELTPEQLAQITRDFRAHGFTITKEYTDNYFKIVCSHPVDGFYSDFTYTINVARKVVCTAKVVGQETKEVEEYDPELLAAAKRSVTKTVDVVEWECHPLLAN